MTADCSLPTLTSNMVSKFFQITGAINNMAEAYYADTPAITNTTAWFDKYVTSGNSVGKITRIVFNYQWKICVAPALADWLDFNLLTLTLNTTLYVGKSHPI